MATAVLLTGCGGGGTTPDQPLSAALVLTEEEVHSAKPSETHSIKTIRGVDEYGYAVLFILGDEEVPVPFLESDLQDGRFGVATLDQSEFGFWLYSRANFEGQRLARAAGANFHSGTEELGCRFQTVFGESTEAKNLPMGTASLSGRMYADAYTVDNPSGPARVTYPGIARLAIELSLATLTGQIDQVIFRGRDEEGNRLGWARLPDTTTFAIADVHSVDGRFAATLSGMDSNDDAQPADSVRGFEGGTVGELYGPAGDEIGAVLNAMSKAHGLVFFGSFAARKEGMQGSWRAASGSFSCWSS